MRQFIAAGAEALNAGNYYGALMIALTLPDMCGAIEYPDEPNAGPRYKRWWRQHMEPIYVWPDGDVMLGASDAWALRCAMLHSGSDIIEGQRASEALDRFTFIQPLDGRPRAHRNQIGRQLQLQVDIFCTDVLQAVVQYYEELEEDPVRSARAREMMTIAFLAPGQPWAMTG